MGGSIVLTPKENERELVSNWIEDMSRMTLKILASLIFYLSSIPKFRLERTIRYALLKKMLWYTRQIFILRFQQLLLWKHFWSWFVCAPTLQATDILFSRKTFSANSFPTCLIKWKQLLYSPLTSVWVLLNAGSKAHSMNISYSHVCWNLLAKYVLFHIPMVKWAKYMNRQFTMETNKGPIFVRKKIFNYLKLNLLFNWHNRL